MCFIIQRPFRKFVACHVYDAACSRASVALVKHAMLEVRTLALLAGVYEVSILVLKQVLANQQANGLASSRDERANSATTVARFVRVCRVSPACQYVSFSRVRLFVVNWSHAIAVTMYALGRFCMQCLKYAHLPCSLVFMK
jgi:hypothetical protein